ncbi:hypothetical protein KPL78_06525 [Roseomonas sp. HJA6]|uniref:Phage-like element PBSX protein XkdF domain-containing protein n=1 Tax=Roseomonas alba TaxID=2846776 RepID=A0ABS7A5N2_9PROT|nr:XkdF-like putative serine protease domain-containing protein [Neoroseomonas alba]MBW6397493.1 hypothetical protein [Neoroseomonas alba]
MTAAQGTILKASEDKRRLYGVALVAGVVDTQGDLIDEVELEEAAVRSMRAGIAARMQHDGVDRGQVIASFPMTREIAAALGFTLPTGNGLWLVGLEFAPEAWPAVRAAVAAGAGLSIGGSGVRT